jgi:membrane-associated phospholipid phosphatase
VSASRRGRLAWIAGLVAWGGALALASRYDLALSAAVADPDGFFGRVVSLAGEWPGWLVVAASLLVLIAGRRPDGRLHGYRPAAWSVILLALLNPLLVTQSLKFLWGRVRYVDLAAGHADFTPFYVPAGLGAGESFPSGHVAMAFVWAPVPCFLLARHRRALAALAWIAGLLYGLGVAWGRICFGRHYLTDTLFTAGLALLASPPLTRLLARRQPRGSPGSSA